MLSALHRLLDLFDRGERVPLLGLFCAIVATAFVQALSVASIVPFMTLVANPHAITENGWLGRIYAFLGFADPRQFLIAAGIAVLVLIIASNALSALTTWWSLRIVWSKNHTLSRRLLKKYLSQPYTYFLNANTAHLSRNILGEVQAVVQGILTPVMNGLAKLVVAMALTGLLLMADPRVAMIVAALLGGAYGLMYTATRRRQARIGQERLQANALRFKTAAEAFGGIKEVKVAGREQHFLRRFSAPSALFSRHMASNQIVSALPRYVMEPVVFGGALLIVLLSLLAQRDVSRILPVVSLYAFAGYRLMPALQQVFAGLASLRFNLPALATLHNDLFLDAPHVARSADMPPFTARAVIAFEHVIQLKDVVFAYPGAATPALHNVSLEIPKNSSIGLVGPTGSGKTTLVDVMLGLLQPQKGTLCVDGRPVDAVAAGSWNRIVGYVPQHIFLCDDTLSRNIAFGVPDEEIDMQAVEVAARIANLHEFVVTLPQQYGTMVGERGVRLSGGQRQRIGIARALYSDPQVIIFDEATSALDGITEAAVMEAIHNIGRAKTLVMIAHRLSSVRQCDAIYMMEGGRVINAGTYQELIDSSSVFRAMAGGAV